MLVHVDAAIDRVLELGEVHLLFLWEQISPEHQHLLLAAAALATKGEPITAAMLATATNASPETTVAALTALVQRDVLRPVTEARATHVFCVDLFRVWLVRRFGVR